MNANDLLDLMNNTKDKFVMEAMESRAGKTGKKVLRLNRVALVAAVMAFALLLMGCVAVFLGLQQRKIGEIPVTQKFDAYGKPVSQPEKTWYIASMSGFDNSPAQQASQEWNEFQRTYQPENLTNETDLPDIPNQYEYTYHCFDQTMVDKVTEIAEKYSLDLLGERAVAQSWQREAAFETLGITRLVREEAPAEAAYGACRVYPPYNFVCDVLLTLNGEDAPWTEEAYCEVYYLQSGYLAHEDAFLYDPETTQEWEYTTADGTKVLLALSGADGTVLAQREDSTIVIHLDMAWQQGVFLDEGTALPTKEALESLADCFDYQIATQAAPMEGLQAVFDAIPDPNDPAMQIPETYASFADFVATVTFPERHDYAFWDIDGDGTEEFLLGTQDGRFEECQTIRDGMVQRYFWGGPWKLMEGGILEFDTSGKAYGYVKLGGPDPEVGIEMEQLDYMEFREGTWRYSKADAPLEVITESQVQEIRAKYTPVELNWQPLMDFPIDEAGTTLGDQLRAREIPEGQALLDFYAENCSLDYWEGDPQWFALRDLDDDGTEDLLLSLDGEKIALAYLYSWGEAQDIGCDFYLCEDGVWETVSQVEAVSLGIVETHSFYRGLSSGPDFLDYLCHNLSTDSWYRDMWDSEPIPKEEALAVQEKYARIDLQWRPISELLE